VANSLNTASSQSIKLDIPGEEYFLATFEEQDVEALQEVLSIDAVSDRLLKVPKPYTLEDAKFWVSSCMASQKHLLSIPTVAERNEAFFKQTNPIPLRLQVIRHNSKMVGCVSLTPRTTEPVVEIGYYLDPSHQGQRIMREAGRKVLRYAANEFWIKKVYSSADDGNPTSAKTIEGLVKDTAIGAVKAGRKMLVWLKGKRIEGVSGSSTWLWRIEAEKRYGF